MRVHQAGRPAQGCEPAQRVVRAGQAAAVVGAAAVVLQQHQQLFQPQMPGQAGRLVADALHQIAQRAHHPGAVVHQALAEPRRQQALRQRHADRHAEPLPKRTGGRLDGGVQAMFRVAAGGAAQLAVAFEHLRLHAGVPGQVQQRVEQRRAVTRREHEAVAVGPVRVGGVKAVKLGPQHGGGVRHADRQLAVRGYAECDLPQRVGHDVTGAAVGDGAPVGHG